MPKLDTLRERPRRLEGQPAFVEFPGRSHAPRKLFQLEVSGRASLARAVAETGTVRAFELTKPQPRLPVLRRSSHACKPLVRRSRSI
jgi:hypothetical protein